MRSKPKLVLIGGGGHCKVVISILKKLKTFDIVGIVDKEDRKGESVLGIEINHTDQDLALLKSEGIESAFVAIGSVGKNEKRKRIFETLKKIGYTISCIISPDAIVNEDVIIGEGTIIMPGVVINAGVKIGKNSIINTGAVIDHDCVIGDHVHIAPNATLSGGVKVGDHSHIGTNATIIQNINICENSIIGAGGVVIRNIEISGTYVGNPAKRIK